VTANKSSHAHLFVTLSPFNPAYISLQRGFAMFPRLFVRFRIQQQHQIGSGTPVNGGRFPASY
jgi:hypothetical protein